MKGFAVPLAFASLASTAAAEPNYEVQWAHFKKKYRKHYSATEEVKRFDIFKANVDIIEETNAKKLSYTLGLNQFADIEKHEFSSTHFGFAAPSTPFKGATKLGTHKYSGEPLADSIDWVAKGAVTPVKDQGQCGSCWSFSATGGLEGAYQVATGNLVSLSEEQYVSCDKTDSACNGGLMDYAFEFAEKNDICTEESYPYTSGSGTVGSCKSSGCTVGIAQGDVTGYNDVEADSVDSMMSALNKGPVSIAIEADKSAFQLYSGGILDSPACGTQLDHGVLLVGYGTDGGKDYWKIKNSWGASWGEEGYIRFARGVGTHGECGLLKQASYPVVKGGSPSPPGPSPPPSPPSPPAPTTTSAPDPGCKDDEDYCKMPDIFDPEEDCELLASYCMETCGCCGSSPKSWCDGPAVVV